MYEWMKVILTTISQIIKLKVNCSVKKWKSITNSLKSKEVNSLCSYVTYIVNLLDVKYVHT